MMVAAWPTAREYEVTTMPHGVVAGSDGSHRVRDVVRWAADEVRHRDCGLTLARADGNRVAAGGAQVFLDADARDFLDDKVLDVCKDH